MVLRRFDFDFNPDFNTDVDMMEHPMDLEHPVGMRTGATIHTRKGLHHDCEGQKGRINWRHSKSNK
jgi:hypothetical protein